MNHSEPTELNPEDAELLDRLLAKEEPREAPGEALPDAVGTNDSKRVDRLRRLLSLLDQWEAGDAEPGLAHRTLSGVFVSQPVSLSPADAEALDALLALRVQGLADGPMPAGVRDRSAAVRRVLSLLDQALLNQVNDEPIPSGLVQRTLHAIDQDRLAQQQRSARSSMNIASHQQGPIGIRQIATTAALFILALSILLPMLSNAQRDAHIAQCSQNLAGLGSDLQQIAFDHNGNTHRPAQPQADVFNPLAKFARTNLDGSTIPASEAGYFVLLDQQRIASQHLSCPTGKRNDAAALYNGQNPAAGGPFRIFLKPRPIFADANPLFRVTSKGLVRDQDIPSLSASLNHNGAGQNVLISDGSVRWMIRPAVERRDTQDSDNIWLYQPGSDPANNADQDANQDEDIFLTP